MFITFVFFLSCRMFGTSLEYIPSFWWFLIALVLLWALAVWWVNKNNGFAHLFASLYEEMVDFFSNILQDAADAWSTTYIVSMFFVILFYNILWLLTDFIAPTFWFNEWAWEFYLADYIGFATSDYHFNMAMAAIGVLIMLGVQFATMSGESMLWKVVSKEKRSTPLLRVFNLVYEYIPFWGKDIVKVEKWTMHPILYYVLFVVVKIFDIIISLFVGFLDIIWLLAKVVSLSFRLFGNMLSGTALLTVLVLWLSGATSKRIWFEFPVLWPIILFAQWLLVACIQAFVFPLLIAIFLKVARMWWSEQTA